MTFEINKLGAGSDGNTTQGNQQPGVIRNKAELSSLILKDFFGGNKTACDKAMKHFKQFGNSIMAEETRKWTDFAKDNGLEQPDGPLRWR